MAHRPNESEEGLTELGAYHIEAGARKFAKWSSAYLKEFNEKDRETIAPRLKEIYDKSVEVSAKSRTIEKVQRKLAKEQGRKFRKFPQSEVPAITPKPPEPVSPPVAKGPWVPGPLPGWARPLTPKPDPVPVVVSESAPELPDKRQSASKMVFAFARLITAGLLLWALARHPIGYYTALRLVTAGVCLYGAFTAGHDKQAGWAVLFWGMVALFQPLIPLAVTRQSWKYIDVIAAVILTASILFFQRPTFRKTVPARPTH